MLRLLSLASVLPVLLVTPGAARDLHFNGLATPTCALTDPIDGVIVLQSDLKSWLTTIPATITAINTAPATLTVTRQNGWAASPSGSPATTFSHTAALTGANIGTLLGAADAKVGALTALGVNLLAVSMSASAPEPFRAGTYTAQVTVTCTVP